MIPVFLIIEILIMSTIVNEFSSFDLLDVVNAQNIMQRGDGQGMGMGSGHDMNMMNMRGIVNEICHMGEGMPPHYCEPNYHVMISVKGLKIVGVDPVGDSNLLVRLVNINQSSNATSQDFVIVGSGEDLAGSTVVESGWKGKASAALKLDGSGSIYNVEKISLHIFPVTH